MTANQINYIVESVLNDSLDTVTALQNNFMIVISKEEKFYTDITRWRYKFNSSNETIERILVRKYSDDVTKIPAHGNYDTVTNGETTTVYEYMTDKDGKLIKDIFSYESILMFIPSVKVRA